MKYLFVISGAFAALFTLLLFTRKAKQHEHWFLGIIFLLITINSSYVFAFYRSDTPFYIPFFSELNYAIPMLYGPLFYFYTKALTTKDFEFRGMDWGHFLPFLIFLVVVLVPVFTGLALPGHSQHGYPLPKLITTPFYLFASIFIIRRYHRRHLEEYSYEQEVNLIWLNWIITGAIILWVIASAGYVYNLFNSEDKILLYDYYTLSFLALFMFALAFVAIRKTDLFRSDNTGPVIEKFSATPADASPSEDIEPQAAPSLPNGKDLSSEKETLLAIMEERKPYLDPLLSLAKLSEASGIPSYKLTKILKETKEGSFYEFVNKYRVSHVQALLKEGKAENYNILSLAMDSGFNSKASFNRIFKKITGITPSAFLKSLEK